MDLPRTAAIAARVAWLDRAGSTNAVLADHAAGVEPWPDGGVVVTDEQTAGRGRLGRSWSAPAGTSLAISVLLRPELPASALGWVPLIAGAAMARALRAHGVDARLKWPNDVLIGGRKVCGVLAEALPDGSVVVGAGLNHLVPADAMPVPTATSLVLEGGPTDPDALVSGWLTELAELRRDLEAAGGDAVASGVHAAVAAQLGTLGERVRVELPDGTALEGRATALERDGGLVVTDRLGVPRRIAAGDVTHLRYE